MSNEVISSIEAEAKSTVGMHLGDQINLVAMTRSTGTSLRDNCGFLTGKRLPIPKNYYINILHGSLDTGHPNI